MSIAICDVWDRAIQYIKENDPLKLTVNSNTVIISDFFLGLLAIFGNFIYTIIKYICANDILIHKNLEHMVCWMERGEKNESGEWDRDWG